MKTYIYNFPKPSVTTDCIIIRSIDEKEEVLLIKRKHDPFSGTWALPGGFVEIDEDLLEGAKRELVEETGLENIELEQFKAYGRPGRDPRGRTISIIFHGKLINNADEIKAGDDAAKAEWFELNSLPKLAFDHEEIIADYLESI